MTAHDRLESELPRLLEHLYLGPRPPYADEALRVAVASPRRSTWSLAVRWPSATTPPHRAAAAARVPWRSILAAGLIVLALLAGAFIVGSRQRALPAPVPTEPALLAPTATKPAPSASAEPAPTLPPLIGPAGNGLIAYVWRGDIYVGDAVTRATTAVVVGPGKAARPIFSPDGTHIAFVRSDFARGMHPEVVVVRADGSDERVVVPEYFSARLDFAWTPDSASLILNHDSGPQSTPYIDGELSIVDASGEAEPRLLTPPLPAWPGGPWFIPSAGVAPMFRPPEGDVILSGDYDALDIFEGDLEGVTKLGQQILEDYEPYWVRWPAWSPDGSMIAFALDRARGGNETIGQIGTFVMSADGSDVRQIAPDGGVFAWSPDGTRIALERYLGTRNDAGPDAVLVVVDVKTGAERILGASSVEQKTAGSPAPSGIGAFRVVESSTHRQWDYEGWSWSPDGRSIVVFERSGTRPLVVDVESGEATELPWESDSAPSWQRVPLD